MAIRIMLDAFDPNSIPEDGWDLLAGYNNGTITHDNYNQLRRRFPNAKIASISTNNDPDADSDIADCELYDYTVEGCVEWMLRRHAKGIRPTAYSSRTDWPHVVRLAESRGLPRTEFDWWAATLDGTGGSMIRCPDGVFYLCVACQVYQILNGTVDLSEVYEDSWMPTASQPLPPLPIAIKEETMVTTTVDGKVTIFGEAVDNSNLLMFQLGSNGKWTVGDITEGVHNSNPKDPRKYQIH